MAAQANSTIASRRAILAGLAVTPLCPVVSRAFVAEDPVFEAIRQHSQAKAEYDLAVQEYSRIEVEHHDIVFYRPRVQVAVLTIFARDDAPETRQDIFAESEKELEGHLYGRTPEQIERLKARFKADQERHKAELERIGYTGADRLVDETGKRLTDAETAVLTAVPLTDRGAIELARFTAEVADDGRIDDINTACATIRDWLVSMSARAA